MTDHNLTYFRNLLQKNIIALESQCDVWEKICSDCSVPEDVNGEIRAAIGLAKLLMNQKLQQFKGLIDDSEFHSGEKEITCSDLEGFWDMVYSEVEKIQKIFERLNKCKNNDWKFVEEISEKCIKKIPVKKDTSAINKRKEISKAQILAARQRIAEAKKRMVTSHKVKEENEVDIVLFNKKGLVENNTDNTTVTNLAVLSEKKTNIEVNDKKKFNPPITNKNSPFKTNDLSDLNEVSKKKSVQKKKYASAHNENIFMDKDSSDLKPNAAKQAKHTTQELKKTKYEPEFVKLQCVTRSAAKRALLLQQNSLQK